MTFSDDRTAIIKRRGERQDRKRGGVSQLKLLGWIAGGSILDPIPISHPPLHSPHSVPRPRPRGWGPAACSFSQLATCLRGHNDPEDEHGRAHMRPLSPTSDSNLPSGCSLRPPRSERGCGHPPNPCPCRGDIGLMAPTTAGPTATCSSIA